MKMKATQDSSNTISSAIQYADIVATPNVSKAPNTANCNTVAATNVSAVIFNAAQKPITNPSLHRTTSISNPAPTSKDRINITTDIHGDVEYAPSESRFDNVSR